MNYAEVIKSPQDLLKIEREDIGIQLFNYLFANRDEGPRYTRTSGMTVPAGAYYGNKQAFRCGMGNYLLNKAIINENNYKVVGFINKRITGDVFADLESKLAKALLTDKITTKDMIDYLDNVQIFGFGANSIAAPTLTERSMFALPEVKKRKEELSKKYAKEIAEGNPFVISKMEKELLDLAKKLLKGDPGMEWYDSGAKPSFGNNYKNMNVMRGAALNPDGKTYSVSTTNFQEGIQKEDTELFANAMVEAAYSVGKGTQVGGYMTKQVNAALQTVVCDPDRKSDCGTKQTIRTKITKFNKNMYLYRYIKKDGKKMMLTDDIIDSYVDKEVDMYDICMCTGDKICNKCTGDFYYMLGILNIGSTASRLTSTILNKALKKKHDNTVKIFEVGNIEDFIF